MNYLAHAFLAGDDVGLLLGGMAGDHFKGRAEGIADPAVRRGVRLHRRIDAYTDAHRVCARSRRRIIGARRRYAGIIIDVAYDHFLSRHWSRFEPTIDLGDFSAAVYRTLAAHGSRLPASFQQVLPRMREHDWLGSYRELEPVGRTLDAIAQRLRRGAPLRGAVGDVEGAYRELEEDFLEFFPELARFASTERVRLSGA